MEKERKAFVFCLDEDHEEVLHLPTHLLVFNDFLELALSILGK